MKRLPSTPFATPLSSSAKETETRLRSIFQYQKKRPPLLVLILAAALVLSCGGLVSCQGQRQAQGEADVVLPFANNLPGEPLDVVIPAWGSLMEDPGQPPLEGLTVDVLPTVPVNLQDFSQSESWNETVWLLSQNTEHDAALYGVLQFSDYAPGMNAAERLYGIIVRWGAQWTFCSLDWDADLWAYEAPELWFGDFDGDGGEELAFALACERGSQFWLENLYLFEPDTLEYSVPSLSNVQMLLSASYDAETSILYAATEDRLLMMDESWVEGAPIGEGSLRGGSWTEFFLRDGEIWCTLALLPSQAPMSNPVVVDCPLVFRDGYYLPGSPELSPRSLPAQEASASGSDLLLWLGEDGQVMQAATQEEYQAGGTPFTTGDDYLYFRF